MIVTGVTSRLVGSGLDDGGGVSDIKNNDVVCGESSVTKFMGESSTSLIVKGDRGYNCAAKIVIAKDRSRVNRMKDLLVILLEQPLIIIKLLVLLSLIANTELLASAAMSPKGDIKVDVSVPKEAENGSYADLTCEWHIYGRDKLYSVKWYKDDHEFFRYVPDNNPKIQTFNQTGVHLDKRANSENSIRLTELTLNSSGQYKCEVSTEAPSFETSYKIGNLTVIILPERAPEITGLSSHYAVGENVTANCTAWPSVPKANLHWTINKKPIPKEYVIINPPLSPFLSSGTPNSLGLRMEAEGRHFEGGDGAVSIRCVAYVGSRRYETEKTVHMAYVNNQRLSAGDLRGGACSDKIRGNSHQHLVAVLLVFLGFYVAT